MTTAIIIENDMEALNYIETILLSSEYTFNIKGKASSVKEAILLIKEVSPDIVFLDIELNDGSGFEILKSFPEASFEIFFITAFDTYYKQAFEHFAFTYIQKPFQKEELETALQKFHKKKTFSREKYEAFNSFENTNNPRILIPTGDSHFSVLIKDIIYLKAEGNYAKIIIKDADTILANQGLVHYTKLLKRKGFFRANRSSLINITHIISIYKKESILLSNNLQVIVSVRNKVHLTELINTLK